MVASKPRVKRPVKGQQVGFQMSHLPPMLTVDCYHFVSCALVVVSLCNALFLKKTLNGKKQQMVES